LSLFRRLLEQMKSEPLGRFPAYPWEPGKFGNQLLDRAHRSEGRRKRQLGNLPHLGLKHLSRATLSLSYRGEHQLAQKLGVAVLEYLGIYGHGTDSAAAVGGHLHHAAAGGRFDGTRGQLSLELLKPALHLLP
jgi:hypothetical protein